VRKTLRRDLLVSTANHQIAALTSAAISADLTWEQANTSRRAICTLLETVLLDSNAYAGFGYLATELNEDGTLIQNFDDLARRYY